MVEVYNVCSHLFLFLDWSFFLLATERLCFWTVQSHLSELENNYTGTLLRPARCSCFCATTSPCGPLTRPAKLADPAALQKDGELDTIRTQTPPWAFTAATVRAGVVVMVGWWGVVEGGSGGARWWWWWWVHGWENVVIHRKGQSGSQDTGGKKDGDHPVALQNGCKRIKDERLNAIHHSLMGAQIGH